jgi:hypothetical protein
MLWLWILAEVFFVAFFVYGYVIYRKRVKFYERAAEDKAERDGTPPSSGDRK